MGWLEKHRAATPPRAPRRSVKAKVNAVAGAVTKPFKGVWGWLVAIPLLPVILVVAIILFLLFALGILEVGPETKTSTGKDEPDDGGGTELARTLREREGAVVEKD